MAMVTIRIDIREGLIFGARSTVTVTRPSLAGAIAAVTISLIGRTSLTLAEVLSALRSERAAPEPTTAESGRVLGDPFGLTRPPVYQRHRGMAETLAEAVAKMGGTARAVGVTVERDLTALSPTVAERLKSPPKRPE